ncbi:MAG: NUDIX domain-containing protein [Flammeovirgaceae bacterium]
MKNPWKTLSSKEVYTNAWISVREDQVTNPNGNPGIYGVVSFKNLAIGIVPLDEEGYTWLVGQYRYSLDLYSWEIPMGGGPIDIPPVESAKRELQEETGLTANQWSELLQIHTSNSVTDEFGIVFLAKGLTEGPTDFEDTEDIQVKKLRLEDAVQMVMSGEITDAISMAALLKTARMLQS